MPRIQLWSDGRKTANYRYQDRQISQFMNMSGTAVFVWLYMGTYGQDGKPDQDITGIQDVLFAENRDRKYSNDSYELRGCYNVADHDFDLKQFGLFLTGDTVFIEFHLNDMLANLGRKIIIGDVLELPHLRDDALLDESGAINKFYVVTDAQRATDGYGSTWLPHIWRVKVEPMTAGQEYQDILDKAAKDPFGMDTGTTLGDILGNLQKEMDLNEQIVEEAKTFVSKRNFETRQFYVVPGDETTSQNPWVYAGDGVPPNGAFAVEATNSFPIDAQDGTYCLRTDYQPHTLFRKKGGAWLRQELDYRRGGWDATHRILEEFLSNNKTTVLQDGTTISEKVALSKAMKLRPDLT